MSGHAHPWLSMALIAGAVLMQGCGQRSAETPPAPQQPAPPPWDEAWEACEDDEECTWLPADCCDCGGRGVNRQHVERARASLAVDPCDCAERECIGWTVRCDDHRCTVLDPPTTAARASGPDGWTMPGELTCDADADCALLPVMCGSMIPVRRPSQETVRLRIERLLGSSFECGEPAVLVPTETFPRCGDGRCEVGIRPPDAERVCRRSADCGATSIGGRWVAAQTVWIEAYNTRVRPTLGEDTPAPDPANDRSAWCFERRCQIRPGLDELANGCESASECLALRGVCGHWVVVREANRAVAEARIAELTSTRSCGRHDDSPAPALVCTDGSCAAAPP